MSASDIICEAIEQRRLLSFTYKGEARIIEPYILGLDDAGTLTLSAVQVSGGSGRGFRTFPLEGVSSLAATSRHFSRNHPDYNPRDRFFASVICQI